MDQPAEARETLELIRSCLDGDPHATRRFQQTYGELIYGYPLRVYRTPADEAGDFYVFAFDGGRIFRRLRTFEGRAPLRAYLLGFVLDDLVLEWKRGQREIDMVSMETMGDFANADSATDRLTNASGDSGGESLPLSELLGDVEPSKAVVMKLLYIEDCELTADELRHVAETSGRSMPDVLEAIDSLRTSVRDREASLKRDEDTLDAVQAWIQLYERRVQRIAADLGELPPGGSAIARLQAERHELERKIERRRQQRAKLLERTRRRKVTAPYKEVAAILNTTVGNVGSQIARLRQELAAKTGTRLRGTGDKHG